jgi:ribosomal protein S4
MFMTKEERPPMFHFTGVIRTNGKSLHVKGQSLERGDSFKVNSDDQGRPWFKSSDNKSKHFFSFGGCEIDYENDKIQFKFATTGGLDGINFQVKDASFIDFDLYMDGRPISRKEIYISDSG